MATWPSTLPAPLLSGYGLDPADQSIRTDMESGAARARRRSYARADMVAAAWSFTDAEMYAFRQWFEDDAEAAGGSAWFTISLRIGDSGATTEECRFVGPWRSVMLARDRWQVTARLEVR